MRELSNQVEELKEETFAAKSRLLLLRASVLQRSIAGSKVLIIHKDEMGGEYIPIQVSYSLDRERKLNRMNTTDINSLHEQVIIDEKLIPGSHVLTVRMVYKGAPWGVFSYMNGYTFTLESSYVFTAEEVKSTKSPSPPSRKGPSSPAYEDRPTIGYQVKTHNLDSASTHPSPRPNSGSSHQETPSLTLPTPPPPPPPKPSRADSITPLLRGDLTRCLSSSPPAPQLAPPPTLADDLDELSRAYAATRTKISNSIRNQYVGRIAFLASETPTHASKKAWSSWS
jgi:hypothetical protein